MGHGALNHVENIIEALADVFRQEPQHEITVFLQHQILSAIPAIGIGSGQMMRTVQFNGQIRFRTYQIDFHGPMSIEGNRQSDVQLESAPGLGQRLKAPKKKRFCGASWRETLPLPGKFCRNLQLRFSQVDE